MAWIALNATFIRMVNDPLAVLLGSDLWWLLIFDAKDHGGLMSVQPDAALAQNLEPDIWVKESFELAKKFAYAPPVSTGKDAVQLTREYEINARNVARSRAAWPPPGWQACSMKP